MTSSPLNDLTLDNIVGVPLSPTIEIRDSLEIERIGDSWVEVLDKYGDLEAQPPYDSTFWKDLEGAAEEKVEVLEEEVLESGVLPDIFGNDTDTEDELEVEDGKPTIISSAGVMNFCKFCSKFCGEQKVCAFHRCIFHECENKRTSKGMCNKHYLSALRRCTFEGCRNMQISRGLCKRHSGANEKRKRCSENDCSSIAQKGGKCYTHGDGQKRCSVSDCTNNSKEGGVCRRHGAQVKKLKCSREGCNYQRKKDGLCAAHHPTSRKCINCQFYQVRYSGDMCSTCAGYRENSEEFKLRELMNLWFQDLKIAHDRIIEGSCLRYRPDFFIEAPNGHIIILEIDEEHHKQYDINCEIVRMFNIQQAIMTPIVFVRYNPDAYKPGGVKTTAVAKKVRHNKLRATITRLIHFPPSFIQGVPEVEYLYYPQPRIELLNEEYNQKINILM